jgi:two-component system cell cycle sensor histidine kinase/response regulator CckA
MLNTAVQMLSQKSRILIVEDEGLIARDMAGRLERAGYAVVGIADSGEEALLKVAELKPELIVMDIRINGDMDGVETATKVRERFDVPIIYLTAHNDRKTLERAKLTAPYGFLTKPLQQSTLQDSIEFAIYKHRMEREVRRQNAWFNAVLRNIADAVIVTDAEQRIQFMNSTAERVTGWQTAEARGQKLLTVLEILNYDLGRLREEHLTGLVPEDELPVSLPRGVTAINRSRQAYLIEGEMTAIVEGDESVGTVINFRDATGRRKEEQVVRHEIKMDAVGRLAEGVARNFGKVLAGIQGEAEQALQQPNLDSVSRSAWESVIRSTGEGNVFAQQLVMLSYVWTA